MRIYSRLFLFSLIALWITPAFASEITCQEVGGVTEINTLLVYPEESVKLKEQGKATLKFLVNGSGYPTEVLMHQSSGFSRLDEAALKAIKSLCFTPAKKLKKHLMLGF